MLTLCPLTACVLVRAVVAVLVAVAEELLGDAGGVPAGELVVVTDRLVSHQQRLHLERWKTVKTSGNSKDLCKGPFNKERGRRLPSD